MDGGRRLAQSLMQARRKYAAALGWAKAPRAPRPRGALRWARFALPTLRIARALARRRGAGVVASALLLAGSLGYGVIRGGHMPAVAEALTDARDAVANTAGFRIAAVALSGNQQITREEILATAGITGRKSLFFFDVDVARAKLKTNPWIADATVLKLYPDRLQIGITERRPFALWQINGKVLVVADDGTVLEPYVARRFTRLPFIVGRGAQTRAKAFVAQLDRYPSIREQVRASVLVAERRWNLRLKSGIDVRLPEDEVERALERLVRLDNEKKLLSRDIVAIDLRLADRVAVRLSEDAAKAREDALKAAEKKAKRKGGDA
ncbi:MAG: FtsQ-type POTRA domain-containing protein [Rhizobiales bacterium]|nr:FtsQ-type POTRA domain-containing protein [Hyphomicrobiales bacterium]